MTLEVIIGNHQEAVEIPEHWLTALEDEGPLKGPLKEQAPKLRL